MCVGHRGSVVAPKGRVGIGCLPLPTQYCQSPTRPLLTRLNLSTISAARTRVGEKLLIANCFVFSLVFCFNQESTQQWSYINSSLFYNRRIRAFEDFGRGFVWGCVSEQRRIKHVYAYMSTLKRNLPSFVSRIPIIYVYGHTAEGILSWPSDRPRNAIHIKALLDIKYYYLWKDRSSR